MDDLIRRQDAIDVIFSEKIDGETLEIMKALGDGIAALTLNMACDRHIQSIKELPSAQPEQPIRCKDCIHWDTTWQNDFVPDYHYCAMVDGIRRSDHYCADAERRRP